MVKQKLSASCLLLVFISIAAFALKTEAVAETDSDNDCSINIYHARDCTFQEAREQDRILNADVERLSATWDDASRQALKILVRRANRFFLAKADAAEIYSGPQGQETSSDIVFDAQTFKQDFLKELQRFSNYKPAPDDLQVDFKSEDQNLNSVFTACMKSLTDPIKIANMRKSEKLWIQYRDAWGKLYQAYWSNVYDPAVGRDFAMSLQTQKRAAFLADKDSCTGNIWHH